MKKNRSEIRRVGVFGGTFNPIHYGHLHIAREAQRLFSLSQVYFVVATSPPHKEPESLIPFTHRYAMVSLATSAVSSFIPSLAELEPEPSPFSVDTIAKFARRFSGEGIVLYFIAGGDSLPEVNSWRESRKLLNLCNFIFAVRPGADFADPGGVLHRGAAARLRNLTGLGLNQIRRRIAREDPADRRIYIVDVGAPDISATEIREMACAGRPIRRLVPDNVREYISKLHLYGAR